jgi:hypothetical protein
MKPASRAPPRGSSGDELQRSFDAAVSPHKCKFKLGVRHPPANLLICLIKPKWVPNGPSQQPQRKPPVREASRPQAKTPRSTAAGQEWRNSWASAPRSLSGETSPHGSPWRRERSPDQNLSRCFSICYEVHHSQWMLPGESWAALAVPSRFRWRGRSAACKTVFDPDLEQSGNTNAEVRRGPTNEDTTRVLVRRWCDRPRVASGTARTRWQMLEPSVRDLKVR